MADNKKGQQAQKQKPAEKKSFAAGHAFGSAEEKSAEQAAIDQGVSAAIKEKSEYAKHMAEWKSKEEKKAEAAVVEKKRCPTEEKDFQSHPKFAKFKKQEKQQP